jgi:drug/metabolite transporter (DMT)-like permease
MTSSHRLRQVAAFAAVYLIWGSSYLAIRFAIETLPGFTMAGSRYLTAGLVLYLWARLRGAEPPRPRHWRSALVIGGLLLLCGNGGVVWAEQHLASGLTALLVATEPLWIASLLWLLPRGQTPRPATIVGLVVGFAGVALVALGAGEGGGAVHLPSAVVAMMAAMAWAAGSLYARGADLPRSQMLTTAIQMVAGGALLLVAGAVTGEWRTFDPAAVSGKSLGAVAYLIVFASIIAFSSYTWLLRTTPPTLVATYAYVNPLVAVLLGALLAGEGVARGTVVAGALILGAVALVSRSAGRAPAPADAARRNRWRRPSGPLPAAAPDAVPAAPSGPPATPPATCTSAAD